MYEPTAGNGALLLLSNPANATVNEINPDRVKSLRSQGYTVTQHDAADYRPDKQQDVVICNPPFGRVRDERGNPRRFKLPGNSVGTSQVDHAIAFRALESMKDDGRAVLILGGKLGSAEDVRSARYNSLESRAFFKALYDNYKVNQHFSVWGDLYRKQGAGFPIDVIVIAGRGPSLLDLPAAEVPRIYKSFNELKELLPNEIQQLSGNLETPGVRRSEFVHGEDASRSNLINTGGVRQSDGPANHLDDPNLDAGYRRRPGVDTQDVEWSAENPPPSRSSFIETDNGRVATPMVLDAGMGRDIRSEERNSRRQTSNRDRTDIPSGYPSNRGSSEGAVDGGTQLSVSRHVAERSDLRNGLISERESMTTEGPRQLPYVPKSKAKSASTIIPANMAAAAQQALDKFETEHGDIDEYVRQNLGYDTKEDLWKVMFAEQIDSTALAFSQLDKGNIFLNGDQTGNGKGRFGAANLIRAQRQDLIPVFVTQKPNLYNAMIGDLTDIGKPGFKPFATNNNLSMKLDDGRRLKTSGPADQEEEMRRIAREGLGDYDAVFTTYSQLQAVSKKEPYRRDFFRAIASRAVFIFDEAHEAGGSTGDSITWKDDGPIDRADFVRSLVDRSAGAVFMSATATKDPAVMDLYARRSDARHAVSSLETLEQMLKDGGVPLQQMMATKFVASGQMLRRERSMEGVSFEPKVVPVDREVADGISGIMRAINEFDRAKQDAIKTLDKQLKKEAKQLGADTAIGDVGASSVAFTSLMHNAIDQGLLVQKAEAVVEETVTSLKNNQKPLIAVASTMDSFIKQYTDNNKLEVGDPIDIGFGDILHRYLERSRDVSYKDCSGEHNRRRLSDSELGDEGVEAYENALELIESTDLSSVPLSSIDYIKWRLNQEGYKVDEITGRQNVIEYTASGETAYGRRSTKETSPQGKVDIVNKFNSGDLDVVILNRSGATGISLHASEKFADQRQRHMIVAQAERDINQVMQMLGRANRVGQVVPPQFTLLMSDLPAEKRLGALLTKKMASLNANTTASRESALSVSSVVDFINPYGEEVITEILTEDPELDAQLSFPLAMSQDEDSEIALISRVTGRIPLLPIEEQEKLYGLIESETQDLIAQKEAMGESILQAEHLDLDAQLLARMEVIPDNGKVKTEFTGPVYLDVVDAKVPSKPLTQLQVVNAVRESLELPPVEDTAAHDFSEVTEVAGQWSQERVGQLAQATEEYRARVLPTKKSDLARDRFNEKLDKQLVHLKDTLRDFSPGTSVRVVSPEQGNVVYGVVSRVWQKSESGSPSAPTNWRVQVLVDGKAKQVTIPLSKFNNRKENSIQVSAQEENFEGVDVYEAFDLRQQQESRAQRQIFTGNIIEAFQKYPNGKFVNYSDSEGNIQQGLIMSQGFDIQKELRDRPVTFDEPRQVKNFITEVTQYQSSVKSLEQDLTVTAHSVVRLGGNVDRFVIEVPKSAKHGGKYFLDTDLIDAVGNEFYSVGDRMEAVVSAERIDQVLEYLMKDKNVALAAFDFKEQARDFLGITLPNFKKIDAASIPVIPIEELAEPLVSSQALGVESHSPETSAFQAKIQPEVEPMVSGNGNHMELVVSAEGANEILQYLIEEKNVALAAIDAESISVTVMGDRLKGEELVEPLVSSQAPATQVEIEPGAAIQSADAGVEVKPTEAVATGWAKVEPIVELEVSSQGSSAEAHSSGTTNAQVETQAEVESLLASQTPPVAAGTKPVAAFRVDLEPVAVKREVESVVIAKPVIGNQGFSTEAHPSKATNSSVETQAEVESPKPSPVKTIAFFRDGLEHVGQVVARQKLQVVQPSASVYPQPVHHADRDSTENAKTVYPMEIVAATLKNHDRSTHDLLLQGKEGDKRYSPSLDQLRTWYARARNLGRASDYLDNIKGLGEQLKAVELGVTSSDNPSEKIIDPNSPAKIFTVGEETRKALISDLDTHRRQTGYVAYGAAKILQQLGRQEGAVRSFEGKTYRVESSSGVTTVTAKDRGKILEFEKNGRVTLTKVTPQDVERFRGVCAKLPREVAKAAESSAAYGA